MTNKTNLSTDSYKGVRDFYPDDMYIQNYIFQTMSIVAESYGYEEYAASVLEPSELYEAKSGEEIVNEQTYTFTDRGDRSVTLRPEMTPTVARMVAAKRRELTLPLRWYSIPNLFRYERPQRGRLREHWQLNVDLFGTNSLESDIEIMSIANDILKRFGATSEMFTIKINSRAFMEHVYDFYSLSDDERHKISKLIDRKNKIDNDRFLGNLSEILSSKADLNEVFAKFIGDNDFSALPDHCLDNDEKRKLDTVVETLHYRGITNAHLDVSIMRGFDYYTGIVFEVFDTNTENNRSLFGGGRYDDLLRIFGGDALPAVGFGMGDVTMRDFLETHDLMPEREIFTDLYMCVLDKESENFAGKLARDLRENGLNVELDVSGKKAGDQIKIADKQNIPFVVCIGEDEVTTKKYKVKNLKSSSEKEATSIDEIVDIIFKSDN